MKRIHKNIDKVLESSLPSAPAEEMEEALERISSRLWSDRVVDLRDPMIDETLLPVRRRPQWVEVAVIAAVVVIAVLVPARVVRSAPAVLEDGAGSRRIQYGEVVSPKGVEGGTLRLTNGSRVEMRSESELSVEHANDGVSIRVHKGEVIVSSTEPLVVETKDISLSGKVFLINAEESGSRIAVIGGEARVQRGATPRTLLPGDQVATNPQMESLSLRDEIAWSREAESHVALLQQTVLLLPSQTRTELREVFQEVSVRPAGPSPNAGGRGTTVSVECTNRFDLDPSRFAIRRVNLYSLVAMAYARSCAAARALDIISGGPDWIRSERFDIEALMPPNFPSTSPTQLSRGEAPRFERLLQAFLADHFKLVVRREMKERDGYVLSKGPDEPKLKPWTGPATIFDPESKQEVERGCSVLGTPDENGQVAHYSINCESAPVSRLTAALQMAFSRPTLDRTGIPGVFEFHFKFAAPTYTGPSPSGQPVVTTAIRQELGLKLEAQRVPVETIVIERAEKPTGN